MSFSMAEEKVRFESVMIGSMILAEEPDPLAPVIYVRFVLLSTDPEIANIIGAK